MSQQGADHGGELQFFTSWLFFFLVAGLVYGASVDPGPSPKGSNDHCGPTVHRGANFNADFFFTHTNSIELIDHYFATAYTGVNVPCIGELRWMVVSVS